MTKIIKLNPSDANRSIDTTVEFPKRDESIGLKYFDPSPKTLMELKALCPHPEKSDERSIWVATERLKYGI